MSTRRHHADRLYPPPRIAEPPPIADNDPDVVPEGYMERLSAEMATWKQCEPEDDTPLDLSELDQ